MHLQFTSDIVRMLTLAGLRAFGLEELTTPLEHVKTASRNIK